MFIEKSILKSCFCNLKYFHTILQILYQASAIFYSETDQPSTPQRKAFQTAFQVSVPTRVTPKLAIAGSIAFLVLPKPFSPPPLESIRAVHFVSIQSAATRFACHSAISNVKISTQAHYCTPQTHRPFRQHTSVVRSTIIGQCVLRCITLEYTEHQLNFHLRFPSSRHSGMHSSTQKREGSAKFDDHSRAMKKTA